MMKRRARVGLLVLGALALGACEYGLGIPDAAVGPDAPFTITNADGTPCVPESPVVAAVLEDEEIFSEVEPEPAGTADEEGVFEIDLEAPELPGHYLVAAQCETLSEENPEGVFFDVVLVGQDFGVTLDKAQVELKDGSATVKATFSPCKAENDFILQAELPEGEVPGEGEPSELLELHNDFPDLDVFVDGVLVTTIEGTERYPTEPTVVPITLTTVGEHVIEGVCTYQTVRWNTDLIEEEISGGDQRLAAAVEYPYPDPAEEEVSPITWNEDTLEAAATVRVLAASVGADTAVPPAAQPAQVTPRYTG